MKNEDIVKGVSTTSLGILLRMVNQDIALNNSSEEKVIKELEIKREIVRNEIQRRIDMQKNISSTVRKTDQTAKE